MRNITAKLNVTIAQEMNADLGPLKKRLWSLQEERGIASDDRQESAPILPS